jgi:hypothetical protein
LVPGNQNFGQELMECPLKIEKTTSKKDNSINPCKKSGFEDIIDIKLQNI